MKDKIYICHTLYHIYITLLKEINSENKADLLISDSVPNYIEISKKISESDIFKKVYTIQEKNIKIPCLPNIRRLFFYYSSIVNSVENVLSVDLRVYKDVIIYNDFSVLGYYLNITKFKYTLNEDGLNLYQTSNSSGTYRFRSNLKNKILNNLHLKPLSVGRSKNMKYLEVNSKKNLISDIDITKVIEVPRQSLVDNLTYENKLVISSLFIDNMDNFIDFNKDDNKNAILILTQPLYVDSLLSSELIQVKLYRDIIDKYINDGYLIYIKPHPRDFIDYSGNFKECTIISKDIPIEILNFNPNLYFDKAITINSTSLDGIQFVGERIKLGVEYLKAYNTM